MSANRDLARSLLAAARRRANKFTRDQAGRNKRESRGDEREITGEYQGPQLLNQSLDDLITERGWQEKMRDSDLFIKWGELVGAEIAEHVQPLAFSEGVLTLSAESTAWATQIRLIHDQIRAALARGGFEVSELLVKGPNAPSWRKGGWRVKGGRGPRDTYG